MAKIKNIIWDFDGVILNSMDVRDWGFKEIFKEYSKEKVDRLIEFHTENGGLSRYVKIRFFFEQILNKHISEEKVLYFANNFSKLMKKELTNKEHLIKETLIFIEKNYTKFNFHIASGSDQYELRFLCKKLNISHYFKTIHGSPTPKSELVKIILTSNQYLSENTCLIGDSINDYDAAKNNNISFMGYNNPKLDNKSDITLF